MKILYVALKYDYGKNARGLSFEHYNFYDSLVKMEGGKNQIIHFAFDEEMELAGREAMNKKLLQIAANEKPDLCFFFLFTDEIFPETIKKITDSGIITYNWFADDHWRWPIYSRYYAPNFSWVSTTDSHAIEKYKNIGYNNIIHTQWACNHFLYHPQNPNLVAQYKHDVTFVGASYGERQAMINNLKQSKISIDCYGGGWPNGRVTQDQMLAIFENSKINLNFTKSSGGLDIKSLSKLFLQRHAGSVRLDSPIRWPDNLRSFIGRWRDQIKGRTFEVPACGGFLLSGLADNITDYYTPDQEVVFFLSTQDLLDKIKYYLSHDEEREKIRLAGYKRTIQDHTYEARFKEIFNKMGL